MQMFHRTALVLAIMSTTIASYQVSAVAIPWAMEGADPAGTCRSGAGLRGPQGPGLHKKWSASVSVTTSEIPGYAGFTYMSLGANDLLYVPGAGAPNMLTALHAHSGAVAWQFACGLPNLFGNPDKPECRSTPAISSTGEVFFGCSNGWFYSLHGENGTEIWKRQVGKAIVSSPILISTGTLYFAASRLGNMNGHLVALNSSSGEMRWSTELQADIQTHPVADSDGNVYVVDSDRTLYKLDGAAGSIMWSVANAVTSNGATMSSAVDVDLGLIYSPKGSIRNTSDGTVRLSEDPTSFINSLTVAILANPPGRALFGSGTLNMLAYRGTSNTVDFSIALSAGGVFGNFAVDNNSVVFFVSTGSGIHRLDGAAAGSDSFRLGVVSMTLGQGSASSVIGKNETLFVVARGAPVIAVETCPAGSFCESGVRSLCEGGTYNPNRGADNSASCIACGAGNYSGAGSISSSGCLPCVRGRYSAAPVAASCTACSPGTYGTIQGGTSSVAACTDCDIGRQIELISIERQWSKFINA